MLALPTYNFSFTHLIPYVTATTNKLDMCEANILCSVHACYIPGVVAVAVGYVCGGPVIDVERPGQN